GWESMTALQAIVFESSGNANEPIEILFNSSGIYENQNKIFAFFLNETLIDTCKTSYDVVYELSFSTTCLIKIPSDAKGAYDLVLTASSDEGYCEPSDVGIDSSLTNQITVLDLDVDDDGYNNDVDCDDENSSINPGAYDIPYNDVDEDCDGIDAFVDNDNDGYDLESDCDDGNASINPGVNDIPYNGVDEDCDGIDAFIDYDNDGKNSNEDCDDEDPNVYEIINVYEDRDLDSYTNSESKELCLGDNLPANYLEVQSGEIDCDDDNFSINPGANDIPYNDVDEDCDGIDAFIDNDNDGVNSDIDCDDTNASIYQIINAYQDFDMDSYTVEAVEEICTGDELPSGFIELSSEFEDCDDENNSIYQLMTLYEDLDLDGFTKSGGDELCVGDSPPVGYMSEASNKVDCDDTDENTWPGAIEIENDDIDQNCDGSDGYIDFDNDGSKSKHFVSFC
ncbi:hypothetical protein BVY04_00895, partial [bacterium M21]